MSEVLTSNPPAPTREQLELSALAAGIGIAWDKERGEFYIQPSELGCERAWRPHLDSEQCFDMETACGMIIAGGDDAYSARVDSIYNRQFIADHSNSPAAARRWASLMVAVEIGRRMREGSK